MGTTTAAATAVQITTQQITVYKIRIPNGIVWADITIDASEDERQVRVSISSDYGNWSYFWGGAGSRGWRAFLRSLGIDYVAGNFGEHCHINVEKTVSLCRKDLLHARRHQAIDRDEARQCFAELEVLEDGFRSESDIYYLAPSLSKLYDDGPYVSVEISPRFRRFWDELWKPWCEYLAAEEGK